MKKSLVLVMVLSLLTAGFFSVAFASAELATGTVIKGEGLTTLYYLGEDGKRYVFPSSKTYFSWYEDFSDVVEVPMETLYEYPLGGNVKYKPGALLVKIQTDPKVYAVGQNGKLRWVKSEQVAKRLYGDNWNKLIDDVPDAFFTDYEVDEEIADETDYDPEAESDEAETISYNKGFKAIVKSQLRNRTLEARRCNLLQRSVNQLQRRSERLGVEIEGIGDDYIGECMENQKGNGNSNKREKVEICHQPEGLNEPVTLEVNEASLRTHFAHGDVLGACSVDSSTDNTSDDATDETTDDSTTDDTASSTDSTTDDSASSTDSTTDDSASSTDSAV